MPCGGSSDASTWTVSWSERLRRTTSTSGSIEPPRRRASGFSPPFGDTIHGDSSGITWLPVSTSSFRASRRRALTRVGSVAVGMHRQSRTSFAWSEPAACIRAAKAESSRPSYSTGLSSIIGSRFFEPNRNGREPRACGGSSTRTSSRNRDRLPPPGLRDRPEVLEELGPLIGLRDLGPRDLRQFQAGRAESRFPRGCERPREGLVCVREGEVTDLARLTDLEGTLGMVEGGLRSTEHGVHAGDLPLSDRELLRTSHDTPVVAGCVGHVDHRVAILLRTALLFEQDPGRIEQMGRHLRMPFGIRLHCHAGLLTSRAQWGWADLNCRRRVPNPEG